MTDANMTAPAWVPPPCTNGDEATARELLRETLPLARQDPTLSMKRVWASPEKFGVP
jgi:hypothetical protein